MGKLLKVPDVDVNMLDKNSRTPWKVAVGVGSKDCLTILAADLRVQIEADEDRKSIKFMENVTVETQTEILAFLDDLLQKRERFIKHKTKQKRRNKIEGKQSDSNNENGQKDDWDQKFDNILQYIEG